MSLGSALSAGLALVGGLLDYGVGVARRLRTQLLDPLTASAPSSDVPAASEPTPEPGGVQARVEEAKYSLGLPERRAAVAVPLDREPGDLPRAYGHDRLVLLPRDPGWVFAYWEITPTARVQALRSLGADAEGAREVLRVYDVTFITFTGDNAWQFIDVELPPGAESWYVNVPRPAASYCAEVGLRAPAGRFLPLMRSNTVSTPRSSPSSDTSVRWARLADGAPVPWVGHGILPARDGVPMDGSSDASGAPRDGSASSEVHAPLPAR